MNTPVRILHLDDSPLDAELIRMALDLGSSQLPVMLQYVQTKEQYLEALACGEFDIILSDYRMAGFDGEQALKVAQDRCPDIPFIMVTGELGEERVIETLQRGATDYVLKDRIFRLIPAITRALTEAENERRRREAEEALRHAHEQTAEVLDSIQDPVYVLDNQWRFVYVNQRVLSVWQKTREELISKVIFDIFPDIEPATIKLLRQVMEERTRLTFEAFGATVGSWVEVRVYPTGGGGITVTFQDISERKRMAEATRESEQRLRAMFDNAALGIVEVDMEDRFIAVNNRICQILGYRREELLQLNVHDITYPDDRSQSDDLNARLRIPGNETFSYEKRYLKRDGSPLWVHVTISAIRDAEGRFEHAIGTVEDISERKKAEAMLQKSRESLELALESTELGLFDFYPLIGEVRWSDRAKRHFGLSQGADVGFDLFLQALHPDDRERVNELLDRCLKPGSGGEYRTEYRTIGIEDRQERWISARGRVFFDEAGQPIRLIGVTLDFTAQKQIEEERERLLREVDRQRGELVATFQAMNDGVMIFDMNGKSVFLNDAEARINGYSTGEAMKQDVAYFARVYELSYPDGRQLPPEEWPVSRVLRGESVLNWELKARRTDTGREWFFSFSGEPVRDETGKQILALIITQDITQRQAADDNLRHMNEMFERQNAELENERKRWREMLEGIADELWFCDVNGKVSLINFGSVTAMGIDELKGKTLDDIFSEIDVLDIEGNIRPFNEAPLLRALRGETVRGEELVRYRKTGEKRYRHHSAAPVKDAAGAITGAVAIVRDVTEAKRAEEEVRRLNEELEHRVERRTNELRRANEELEAFSYSVSHDLKAPLRVISGFSRIMSESMKDTLPEKQLDNLRLINDSATRMGQLIDALLSFSRLGQKEPEHIRVDVLALFEQAIDDQRRAMGEGANRINVVLQDLPPALGDPVLLRQVAANLVSNAFKFTSKQSEPRVEIGAYTKNGLQVYFVRDNGVGFPSGHVEKLFRVFQRLHPQSEFEGSGIGLANVRKIVERLGGDVCAEGEEGKGATFYFTLPAAV